MALARAEAEVELDPAGRALQRHLRVGRLPAGEDDDPVHAQLEPVDVHLREPARAERGAGGGEDAAPVRVAAERGGLDERRGGDPPRDRVRLAGGRRARDLDLEQRRSRPRRRRRSAARGRRRPRRARRRTRASVAAVRSTPLSPFASRMTASFVEHSPSTEILLKLWSTARLRKPCALVGRQRVVGGDDREHRREVRVDHPGTLRHPADREAAAPHDRLLGARVGGQDRLRRVAAAVRREPRSRPRPASSFGIGSFDPDHAGREHEHLLGVEPEQRRGLGRRRERVQLALLAGRRVGDAGVDHDRLRLGLGQVRLRDESPAPPGRGWP